jgi:predicted O-methyltransferase YrrM
MNMHMTDILSEQIDRFLDGLGADTDYPLQILETGTIRQDTEAHRLGDGWSTLTFAKLAGTEGHVTSIDLDVSVARAVLAREGVADRVTLREGHSIEWMASMIEAGQKFDVILLDSDNDPQLILHEYLLARKLLRRPGLLLVDDVVPGSATVVKGQQLVPWLDGRGVDNANMPRTGRGVYSGVLAAIL